MTYSTKEFTMKIQTLMTALVIAASGAAYAQTVPAVPATPAAPTAPARTMDLKPVAPAAQVVQDPVATPELDKHQAEQKKSIDKGVAAGQLNPKEAAGLEKREAKLDAAKKVAKADGKVTKKEHKKLKNEVNQNSEAIDKQKADKPVIDVVK
jgi:hypothetical protein